MNGFNAEWLRLREPYDHSARNTAVERRVIAWCRDHGRGRNNARLRVVDLGAGTGSNFRALSPQLPAPQDWLLLDHDARLLDQVAIQTRSWADDHAFDWRSADDLIYIGENIIRCQQIDFAHGLKLPSQRIDLLCAAALMDLVSAAWFESLVHCGCNAIYTVLTYDSRIEWQPQDAWDETARVLFNRHQLGDKGFGPALGPQAPAAMAQTLRIHGFEVLCERSDWLLAPVDRAIQCSLLQGWRQAIAQIAPARELEAWAERRQALIDAGDSRLRVGHRDLFAYRSRSGPQNRAANGDNSLDCTHPHNLNTN